MIVNEFIQGNQFSSVSAIPNQPLPSQPSNTGTSTKTPHKPYSVFTFSRELGDGSKDLRISLKE